MSDDSNYNLTSISRMFNRRAKKAKTFWLNCLATRERLNHSKSAVTRSDSQTQTTPTINKTFVYLEGGAVADVLQMRVAESCVADSSRDTLGSHSEGSSESLGHVYASESTDTAATETCLGAFPCQRSSSDSDLSKWPPYNNIILDKLSNLEQEIHQIHATLSSIKTGVKESIFSSNATVFPRPSSIPPPPPPPPPFPPSPVFLHSVSLQTLHRRPPMTKIQCDEMSTTQDKSKPIVTLEDLQKVKLRQVSSVANMKC